MVNIAASVKRRRDSMSGETVISNQLSPLNSDINFDVVTFVLDESGSMASDTVDTIAGYNNYVEGLKSAETPTRLKLITFNTKGIKHGDGYSALDDTPLLDGKSYRPSGGTPLLDAVGEAIQSTDSVLKDSEANPGVIIAILTDGFENASREYTQRYIKSLVEQKQEEKWQFIFLAANQDAWSTGRDIGINPRYTFGFAAANKSVAFRRIANSSLDAKRLIAERKSRRQV